MGHSLQITLTVPFIIRQIDRIYNVLLIPKSFSPNNPFRLVVVVIGRDMDSTECPNKHGNSVTNSILGHPVVNIRRKR